MVSTAVRFLRSLENPRLQFKSSGIGSVALVSFFWSGGSGTRISARTAASACRECSASPGSAPSAKPLS